MEDIRKIDGLTLGELEGQTLDLLPDREEMKFVYNPVNVGSFDKQLIRQSNRLDQDATAVALFGSDATALNVGLQSNAASNSIL